MTLSDLLALAWRHRLVTAACLMLTGTVMFLVSSPVEAWNARVSVVLLVPKGTPGNPIASSTNSLIATTGVVARAVKGAGDESQTVSSELDLSSVDAEPDWTLRQPSAGGQWDVEYEDPRLDVRSWGHTPDEASAQMRLALAAIDDSLRVLQDEADVRDNQRIQLTLSPDQPVFTLQSGSRVRAMAGTGLAGLLGTLAAVMGIERLAERRRSALEPRTADGAGLSEFADSNG